MDVKRQPDGTSRGFAFVRFADSESVERVIEAHAKHMIDNKWVEVKRHDGQAACAGKMASLAKEVERETDREERDEGTSNSRQEEWEDPLGRG